MFSRSFFLWQYSVTKPLAGQLEASDTWSRSETCYQHCCLADYGLFSSFPPYSRGGFAFWACGIFVPKQDQHWGISPTIQPLVKTSWTDAHVPAGWGELIVIYSQSTSWSSQPGERPVSTYSGDVALTWQHFVVGHDTEERFFWNRIFGEKWHWFLWARCPTCHLVSSVKALKKTQSSDASDFPHPFFIRHWTPDGRLPSLCRLVCDLQSVCLKNWRSPLAMWSLRLWTCLRVMQCC